MSFLFWWFAFGSIGHHASGAAETQLTQTRTGMMPWLTLTITKCLELATRRTWAGIRLGNFRKIWKAGSRLRSSRCGPAKIHRDNLDIDCVDWTWLCWLGFISFLFFFRIVCVCVIRLFYICFSVFLHLRNKKELKAIAKKSPSSGTLVGAGSATAVQQQGNVCMFLWAIWSGEYKMPRLKGVNSIDGASTVFECFLRLLYLNKR